MPDITCPSQDLNYLNPNSFQFSIARLPTVSFFCQSVNVPGVSLLGLEEPTTQATLKLPSDKLTFETLSVQFIVDSQMKNYLEIFKWMQGLGHPQDYRQYTVENRSFGDPSMDEEARNYSDAFLVINNTANQQLKKFTFVDCHPTSLSGFTLSSMNTDVQFVTATMNLEYTYYTVE